MIQELAIGVGLFLVASVVFFFARRAYYSRAVELRITVDDDSTVVTRDGEEVLREPNLIRYVVTPGPGLPSVLNFSTDAVESVDECRFGADGEVPRRGVLEAFLGACCQEARRRLGLGELAPLEVVLGFALTDEKQRRALSGSVTPKFFNAMGAKFHLDASVGGAEKKAVVSA